MATASQSPKSKVLCIRMTTAVSFRNLFHVSHLFLAAPFDSFTPLMHHKTFHIQDRIDGSSNTFASSPGLHSVSLLQSFAHGFAYSYLLLYRILFCGSQSSSFAFLEVNASRDL
jgi:hypothetical protein